MVFTFMQVLSRRLYLPALQAGRSALFCSCAPCGSLTVVLCRHPLSLPIQRCKQPLIQARTQARTQAALDTES